MVLQTVFTRGVTDRGLEVISFSTIVLAIVFGWLLVSVYQRVLENLSYETLGLNSRSTLHALIVAILTTIIFITTIWMIDEYEIVSAEQAGAAVGAASEGLLEDEGGGNPITQTIAGSTRFGHPIVLLPTGI
jgi:hypothetical protein